MDEFERAVMVSLDPTVDLAVRSKALEALQQVGQSEDGWRFALEKLVQNRPGTPDQVQFYCLQVLVDSLRMLDDEPRSRIRSGLLAWTTTVVSGSSPGQILPAYLKNKAAEAVTICVECDYPSNWPAAFTTDIMRMAEVSEQSMDIFFRIMRALDDMITSREAPLRVMKGKQGASRATDIRDAMREDCLPSMVALWKRLLANASTIGGSSVTVQVLDLVRRFVEWIDISLVVADSFIPCAYLAFQPPINGASDGQSISGKDTIAFRATAAATLTAIVSKRMDSSLKLSLLESLEMRELLVRLPAIVQQEKEQDSTTVIEAELGFRSAQTEVAMLANRCATQALECVSADSRAVSLMEAAMPTVLLFLRDGESDDDGDRVAEQSLEFVTAYVTMCRTTPTAAHTAAGMTLILQAIVDSSVYPPDFDPGQEDSQFHSMRNSLMVVFQNIGRASPLLARRFLQDILVTDSSTDIPPRKFEVLIQLLMKMVEVEPEEKETIDAVRWVLTNPPSCLDPMETSSAIALQQRLFAAAAYFELCSRSHRLVLENPQLLGFIMPPFLDGRGVRNPNQFLQLRATHFLLKLVRSVRHVIATSYLDGMVITLKPLLEEATLNGSRIELFEITGLVLGCNISTNRSSPYFPQTMSPLLEGLRTAVLKGDVAFAIRCIKAAGLFSKGFSGTTTTPTTSLTSSPQTNGASSASASQLTAENKSIWKSFLTQTLDFWAANLSDANSRSATIFLLHRMVETLEIDVLPIMMTACPALLQSLATISDLSALILLIDQMACKFKSDCEELINAIFLLVVRRVFEFSGTANAVDPESEEYRENMELRKRYYTFLLVLLGNDLGRVMLSGENGPFFKDLVVTIFAGASGEVVDSRHPTGFMRLCFQILGKLVKLMVMEQRPELQEVVEQIGVVCISSMTNKHLFPSRDSLLQSAGRSAVMENVNLQFEMVSQFGKSFPDYICGRVLPRYGLMQSACEEFSTYLSGSSEPDRLRFFVQFSISRIRSEQR